MQKFNHTTNFNCKVRLLLKPYLHFILLLPYTPSLSYYDTLERPSKSTSTHSKNCGIKKATRKVKTVSKMVLVVNYRLCALSSNAS